MPAGAAPVTTASPPIASAEDGPRRALLQNVLDQHHAAGDFVGARIALRDADGIVTETTAGTTTIDPASGPVDPDVAWNIGSTTKTFVAVVVLQLAEEGALDLDAGIEPGSPSCPAPIASPSASCSSTPAGSVSTRTNQPS